MTDLLLRSGAPATTVEALRHAVADRLDRPTQLVAFATGDRILTAFELPGVASPDRASWGAPAHILPLLSWIAIRPSYVEVVVDRTGADITEVAGGAVHGSTTVVAGPDDEIERNAPGGRSQPSFQRPATDAWHHNAAAVAAATAHALSRVGARLLLVAGDIRAIHLLLARLPQRPLLIRRVSGGRGPDGSAARRAIDVARARAAYAEETRLAMTAALRNAATSTVIEGADRTLTALAGGRVRTLFIDRRVASTGTAWFGSELLCAARPVALPGGDGPRRGGLVDVAVRAALLTDAAICQTNRQTVPIAGGIGALCRYR
ncbi:Vms1/Ankzf1 family peptidyl-tRNA hydrolase [Asanoa sp. NPDC049573]|uniref:baeRF2 domain-containing protein n=1 Tax=Asanoa sp. NPDC049573 TaxID=3155396 RepID=UPI0034306CAE